jgi:hypothetical protein
VRCKAGAVARARARVLCSQQPGASQRQRNGRGARGARRDAAANAKLCVQQAKERVTAAPPRPAPGSRPAAAAARSAPIPRRLPELAEADRVRVLAEAAAAQHHVVLPDQTVVAAGEREGGGRRAATGLARRGERGARPQARRRLPWQLQHWRWRQLTPRAASRKGGAASGPGRCCRALQGGSPQPPRRRQLSTAAAPATPSPTHRRRRVGRCGAAREGGSLAEPQQDQEGAQAWEGAGRRARCWTHLPHLRHTCQKAPWP